MNIFGKRIELYDIVAISDSGIEGSLFSLTSNGRSVSTSVGSRSVEFKPSTISRSAINLKTALEKQTVTVSVSSKEDVSKHFLGAPLESAVYIRIYDFDGVSSSFSWRGRLTGVKDAGGSCQMIFEASTTQMQQNGLFRKSSRMCPYVVYDVNTCKASIEQNSALIRIIDTDGQKVIFEKVSGILNITDNALSGGFVELMTPSKTKRFIESNDSDEIILFSPLNELIDMIGQEIRVLRGCDKSPVTCRDDFSNLDNFGGLPFIPTKNPFDGALI